ASPPQDRDQSDFRAKKMKEKGKKSGKRLQQTRRFLFQFLRAAGLMERHHLQQGGPELLTGQGIGVVQPRRLHLPALGYSPDGQVLFEAQAQQLHALDRVGAGLNGAMPLQPGRLRHDRSRPGAVEEPGLTWLIRRDFRQRDGGADGPAFETASDVADNAIKEGAKRGHSAGAARLQRATLAETLDEHLLCGVVEIVSQRRAAPAGSQVSADDTEVAAAQFLTVGRAA